MIQRIALTLMLGLSAAVFPNLGVADTFSLMSMDAVGAQRRALLPSDDAAKDRIQTASLFIGQEGASFFAPFPKRQSLRSDTIHLSRNGTQVDRVRHLIAKAEAGSKQYDAVQYGAKIKPSKRPTQMTLGEIYKWINDTPGQPHAIGRYQFIPPTLKSLARRLGLTPDVRFTPDVQDKLADVLLVEAGLIEVSKGQMKRHTFMNNLAKIWAGLPNSSGKSHYHGYAGNKASMTWAYFDREMKRIFPS